MRLAKVIGQVVSTAKLDGLSQGKLTLIQMLDASGEAESEIAVACDIIGAGVGEWVFTVSGSSARVVLTNADQPPPIDLLIVGIIDQVSSSTGIDYSKKLT
ncbi:Ethanolamine utilization protein EutN [Sinobacterium norvegicum]|uniref:Ethanolamine utilization protein EutN n=1 Tax=Sinobacterium norvegicum TaxID=1641715 RepID=A0ABN8EEN7_9GAMM|nr:EutN/CcmL family microcompartment protein [Sinobacterium norvegicum]CAH0990439.1 Ethanolamine utilization protein EutN [Sinobacterium norvegicum]